MRLVMLGGPGAGKGTQANTLNQTLQIPVISTGGILREAIAVKTPLGLEAEPYVTQGELIPDMTMIEFMRSRLLEPDMRDGWILEGYPRTAFQAEELDFLLEDLEQPLDWAIYLQISEETMMQRSLARSLWDDQPEIIEKRIANFQERTIPLLEYYAGKKTLLTLSAEDSPEQVETLILEKIKC